MAGIKEDRMNHEEMRLRTFDHWPISSPVDSSRLAKAGFYYSGSDIICFSCKGQINEWDYGDVVLKKHSERFPDCDFINNRSDNVPFTKCKSVKESMFRNDVREKIIIKDLDSHFERMKVVNERLKTFAINWPLPFLDIQEMVVAGFFYTGISDKVQCPFCKGIISNWEKGDIPLTEHSKHFPWCDYVVQSILKCKSSPCVSSSSEDVNDLNNYTDLDSGEFDVNKSFSPDHRPETHSYRLIDKSQHHKNLEVLGVNLHQGPVHPEYANFSARLKSFSLWPTNAAVRKEDLAAAGFFYVGTADHTRCFYCNGGLCRWEKYDDPWVEHAQWFCNCNFLQLNKGRDFIESCLAENTTMVCMHKENTPGNSQCLNKEPLTKQVDDAMNSNLIKHALNQQLYPTCLVRAAVALQIKENGVSFSDIDSLCLTVARLKEDLDKVDSNMEQRNGQEDYSNDSRKCLEKDMLQSKHLTPTKVESLDCFPVECSSRETNCTKNLSHEDLSKEHYLCKICMDREVALVFLPCGHLLSCSECAPALTLCPMCRKNIQATVRAYLN